MSDDLGAPAAVRKLCFLVLHAGAVDLADCATPVLHALTASAMECEVEMYFIGSGVRILSEHGADAVIARELKRSLATLLDDAHESGIRIHACTSAWKAHLPTGSTLASQCAGFAGAATYLGRAMDPAWRVLSY